jgi:hypothetical protein
LFADASNDVSTVFGEVFMQQCNSKLIEFASRPDRPTWTARISGFERTCICFSERVRHNRFYPDWVRFKTAIPDALGSGGIHTLF